MHPPSAQWNYFPGQFHFCAFALMVTSVCNTLSHTHSCPYPTILWESTQMTTPPGSPPWFTKWNILSPFLQTPWNRLGTIHATPVALSFAWQLYVQMSSLPHSTSSEYLPLGTKKASKIYVCINKELNAYPEMDLYIYTHIFYWSIFAVQYYVSYRCTLQWFTIFKGCTTFIVIKYWLYPPIVQYILVAYFIPNSSYLLIPNSQSIPPLNPSPW